jgi:LysM repeat protein
VVASSIHAVKWGETLFSIASLYDLTVEELREINHLDGNVIKEGQTLRVNSANVVDGSAVAEHKHQNRIADSAKEIQHKVVKGETFFSIAKQYGCTADQLMEWNHQSADKLYVGAKLRILKELN